MGNKLALIGYRRWYNFVSQTNPSYSGTMKDIAHYAPLLSDSDDGDPVVSPRWPEKRTSIFHLAIIVAQALLIIGLVALNWSTYTKSKSAACSQVVYCKIFIFPYYSG